MECTSCNEPLKPHWKLCPACGDILVGVCRNCGGAMLPGAHACPACNYVHKVDCGSCGAVMLSHWKACPECGATNVVPQLSAGRFQCRSCQQELPEDFRFEESDVCQACAIGPDLNPAPELAAEAAESATPAHIVEMTPGEIFQDQLEDDMPGPEMVRIPAGEFRMGDINGLGTATEKPVHTVTIAHPFALGRFPVTFDEYDQYAQETGIVRPGDSGWGRGNRPVIIVSWECAQRYVRWLSERTGESYRLPSEAEWEYAARAGTETAYPWGNEISPQSANYLAPDSPNRTLPVGSFAANALGLFDMHGNVWEWVEDTWHDRYLDAPTDGSAWTAGGEPGIRVLRGGSWYAYADKLRSASRNSFLETGRNMSIGFRLARDL